MQHAASHTTAVQPSSHNQRHVLIGKQWYQLPELIPTNSNSGLHNCVANNNNNNYYYYYYVENDVFWISQGKADYDT